MPIAIKTKPAGSDGQVQYKNGRKFGGAAELVWDDVNNRFQIGKYSSDAKATLETEAVFGAEILSNGTFTDNADGWVLGTGWTYGSNSISFVSTNLITNGNFTGNANGWTLGANWAYDDNNVNHSVGSTETLKQSGLSIDNAGTYFLNIAFDGGGSLQADLGSETNYNNLSSSQMPITASGADGTIYFKPSNDCTYTCDDIQLFAYGQLSQVDLTIPPGNYRLQFACSGTGTFIIYLSDGDSTVSVGYVNVATTSSVDVIFNLEGFTANRILIKHDDGVEEANATFDNFSLTPVTYNPSLIITDRDGDSLMEINQQTYESTDVSSYFLESEVSSTVIKLKQKENTINPNLLFYLNKKEDFDFSSDEIYYGAIYIGSLLANSDQSTLIENCYFNASAPEFYQGYFDAGELLIGYESQVWSDTELVNIGSFDEAVSLTVAIGGNYVGDDTDGSSYTGFLNFSSAGINGDGEGNAGTTSIGGGGSDRTVGNAGNLSLAGGYIDADGEAGDAYLEGGTIYGNDGNAGDVFVSGGDAGSGTGNGGNASLLGGDAAETSGDGGNVVIASGLGVGEGVVGSITMTVHEREIDLPETDCPYVLSQLIGGNLIIDNDGVDDTADGAVFNFYSGYSTDEEIYGGNLEFYGGDTTVSDESNYSFMAGGGFTLGAGGATGSGNSSGATIEIEPGRWDGDYWFGGDIFLEPGSGDTNEGKVYIYSPSADLSASLDASGLTNLNKNFAFPDISGTLLTDENGISLLSRTTSINAETTGTTNLYTVPVGKVAVVTGVVIRCTSADTISGVPTLGVGIAAGEADIMGATALTGLNATTEFFRYSVEGAAAVGAAEEVIKLGIDVGATATTMIIAVDLFGYLITLD